jgi:hypothetical protein
VHTTSDQIEHLTKATKGGLNWAQTARNMHDTHIARTLMELLKKGEQGAQVRTGVLGQVCACISRQTDDMEESWEDQIDSYADIPEAMPLQGFEWQTEFALRPFNGESITFIKKMEAFARQFTEIGCDVRACVCVCVCVSPGRACTDACVCVCVRRVCVLCVRPCWWMPCTGLHVLHTCAYAPQGRASSGELQAIGFGGR